MKPSVVYILPATNVHGGIRVVFEHADLLLDRGYDVTVTSPDPPPDWHALRAKYRSVDIADPSTVPRADIAIGTYWTTIPAAVESGAPTVFHFCQGWEGVHPEYAPILPQIDEQYRRPIPKLLVSTHLKPVLEERYGARCHWIGQAIDATIFTPVPFRESAKPLRVGVVGHYGIRPKGINELLDGLLAARRAGFDIEVHHASAGAMPPEEKALGIVDRYYERLTTAQMADFYRGLDVYFHPSWDEEGFPLPPLEAMASGVAVAVTDIRSFRPLPDDSVIRYPFGRAVEITPIIERMGDPAVRRSLREAGMRAIASYRHEVVIDRLEAAFAEEQRRSASRRS